MQPLRTWAQQEGRSYRLGILELGQPNASAGEMSTFISELARLGFVEGPNLAIDRRFAQFDRTRLESLAAELVALKPDVIFTSGGWVGAAAAIKATKTIPIVYDATNDPVASGLVASLAQPGGNVTGTALFGADLDPKRLQLLVEAVGSPMSIAVLDVELPAVHRQRYQTMFPTLGLSSRARLQFIAVDKVDELKDAFDRMARGKVDALVVGSSAFTFRAADHIAALIAQHRLPAIAEGRGYTEGGVLVTYSTNFIDLYRRGADYVARIFNGAKPAELPIVRATKFNLAINLKTAKALGLRIPSSLLIRADTIIE
jgi:putative ABC transport system substrate-binding protein